MVSLERSCEDDEEGFDGNESRGGNLGKTSALVDRQTRFSYQLGSYKFYSFGISSTKVMESS